MDNTPSINSSNAWLDKPAFSFFPKFTTEHLIVVFILLMAVISRFYNLGQRDMSFDEINHVVPSSGFYEGEGYQYNPVTHGPLKFHLVAATYFLFGDNDTTSRIPVAVFSVLTIAFIMMAFKHYLGRIGALLAGLFYTISPYMLFYGRYLRDEAIMAFFGVVIFYAVLRYLEKGKANTLLLLSVLLSLQFCTEETAFIYTAILLLFLGIVFLKDVARTHWKNSLTKDIFSFSVITMILLVGVAVIAAVMEAKSVSTTQPFTHAYLQSLEPVYHIVLLASLGLAAIALILALATLFRGLGGKNVKTIRSFDLLILTFTLVMPLLTALPVKLLGWDPLDYTQSGLLHTSLVLVTIVIIAVAIGLAWNPSLWLKCAGVFFAIFVVFYTTFFTNGEGFFTGIVGSLGYWLSQQSFARGTQPWYYYAFLQIPMYEYLGASGLILAVIYGFRHHLFTTAPGISPAEQSAAEDLAPLAEQLPLPAIDTEGQEIATHFSREANLDEESRNLKRLPVLALLLYWSVISLIAYNLAGEKMPWLSIYIVMPILLAAGWGVGYLVETLPWTKLRNQKSLLAVLLTPILLVSFCVALGKLLGPSKPFAGNNLDQLQATSTFMFSIIAFFLSGWGILVLLKDWRGKDLARVGLAGVFFIFTILTARSSFQASFINFDNAKEFLVYAHGTAGAKEVANQVQEISERTTGGKNIKVAYIGDTLYPYWWYCRDYPNKMYFKNDLTKELLNYPLVISDDIHLTKVQSILGDNYSQFDYKLLWWPMMDYTNLNYARIKEAVTNPQMIEALFEIWLNKDYTLYAKLTKNPNLTLETWQPSTGLHFFIKKDIVGQIWNYGMAPTQSSVGQVDPYTNSYESLTPDIFFGQAGSAAGQFADAHGIALAADGSVYVADSNNNRIEHFSATGQLINSWGGLSSMDADSAPGGTFKEPWGIAVAPDGSVYVADTWNYRIQKFSAEGKFLTMWGEAGQGDSPDAFWGPRGVAVDQKGNVYITDTGNKRVVVFDSKGKYITEFGSYGMDPGQFDEPVGIAVDKNGAVYVADTWNKRIQVFTPDAGGITFTFSHTWNVDAWDSESTENKPFLAVDNQSDVFVSDPSGFRILEFSSDGQIIRAFGQYSSGIDGFGNPGGVAVDDSGHLWVMDSANSYVLRFPLTTTTTISDVEVPLIPTARVVLKYDAGTDQLIDDQNVAYYKLDAARKIWVPIVPLAVSNSFSETLYASLDELNNWFLKTASGTIVYRWDANTLNWQLLIPVVATEMK
jgi:predicted membrane-bound mannosyltransferase/sugar lactone lactonase YvrE